jgi:hypothetical protein
MVKTTLGGLGTAVSSQLRVISIQKSTRINGPKGASGLRAKKKSGHQAPLKKASLKTIPISEENYNFHRQSCQPSAQKNCYPKGILKQDKRQSLD